MSNETMALAAVPTGTALEPMFITWLKDVVDLSDCEVVAMLSYMSTFFQTDKRRLSETQMQCYAAYWIALAEFLYAHRELQLDSALHMTFIVPNNRMMSDIYWFEVVNAARLLGAHTVAAVQVALGMASLQVQPGEVVLRACVMDQLTVLAPTQNMALHALAVCHYALEIAYKRCMHLPAFADATHKSLLIMYNTLRAACCWIQGLRLTQMLLNNSFDQHVFKQASSKFATLHWLLQTNSESVADWADLLDITGEALRLRAVMEHRHLHRLETIPLACSQQLNALLGEGDPFAMQMATVARNMVPAKLLGKDLNQTAQLVENYQREEPTLFVMGRLGVQTPALKLHARLLQKQQATAVSLVLPPAVLVQPPAAGSTGAQ